MKTDEKIDVIEVWRPHGLAELELRKGFSVARPVPRHWHEEYQLCLIQSGSGELKYRGDNLTTPPASLFIVFPGEVHSNRAFDDVGCSYRTLFINLETMRRAARDAEWSGPELPYFPRAVMFDQDILTLYLDLHREFERPCAMLEQQSLLLNFLAMLVARFAENRPAMRPLGDESRSMMRARDYLAQHYAENVSLEDLARVANLSPFHFNRVFSRQFGMPPHAFQTQLRVASAKALLREGWTIAQAASQSGFVDQSHLTRHFKRLVAVTPGQYIQNSKNIQDSV